VFPLLSTKPSSLPAGGPVKSEVGYSTGWGLWAIPATRAWREFSGSSFLSSQSCSGSIMMPRPRPRLEEEEEEEEELFVFIGSL